MRPKFVHCFLHLKDKSLKKIKVRVPPHEKTIYDALGFFEDEVYKKLNFKFSQNKVTNSTKIREIINLHDEEGLKINKIKEMFYKIKKGNHILEKSGIPNIKLIKNKEAKLVIFDGHHSILSYLLSGKNYLTEIPHIIIESEKDYFEDEDISIFFHKYKNRIRNWKNYVVNWNASPLKQLVERKRKNIGELFDSIKNLKNLLT